MQSVVRLLAIVIFVIVRVLAQVFFFCFLLLPFLFLSFTLVLLRASRASFSILF